MAPFMFCPVCRINHDKGKGHKYGVKHKQHLAEFLSKARKKIQDVRVSLKEVKRDEDRWGNKFWCPFCGQEVEENAGEFAREKAIEHLGSSLHFMNVKNFFSEHGADFMERNRYFFSKEDILKWKERCNASTATVASAGGVELIAINNIHSDTSRHDRESSLAVGNRQTVSLVVSIDDVQPLSVLTFGSSQKPTPTFDGAPSVPAANENQSWFPTYATAETRNAFSNGWGSVAESAMPYMDPASRMVPANLDIEATTTMSSQHYLPESSNEVSNYFTGGASAQYSQVSGGGSSATNDQSSFQHYVPSFPTAAPIQFTVVAAGQELAAVVCPPLQPGEGNVHSGATPPWIGPSQDRKQFAGSPSVDTANRPQLSKREERKLAKLRPPNRVGAAWAEMRRAQLERERRGEATEGIPEADATWLPNFGRVWQSGSRHDTRKEFEAEKRREAKRLGRPLGKRGATSSESPVQFQPYVSKRQKMTENDG